MNVDTTLTKCDYGLSQTTYGEMTMTNRKDLLALITDLRDDYDHAFLSQEDAHKFSKPFGFMARTFMHEANPRDPKGLTLANGAKSARGIGAHSLACQIADHLGVQYESKLGRGSQLRAACDAVIAHLNSY